SLETCTQVSDGLAIVAPMDEDDEHLKEELIFSSRFACPICGYNITELEPRIFSFNNPAGACPSCDGLGAKQFFDPAKVIASPELTLAEGAIKGWDRRVVYYVHLLQSLATHYQVDIDTPFQKLPKDIQHKILYVSDGESIKFNYLNTRGDVVHRNHPFEGVINNMER